MAGRDRSVSRAYSILRYNATKESEKATHVALDGGMWKVKDYKSFWDACSQDILEGKLFPLCEFRSLEVFPMFFDFDAKVSKTITKPSDFTETIVKTINKQISKFFKQVPEGILDTYVLGCERLVESNEKIKYGFHIHWPNLYVNQYNALLIRMSAIAGCRTLVKPGNFYSHIDLDDAFDITPLKNSKGSLRLLGAPKPKPCPECNNTAKLKKNCNMCIRSGFLTPDNYTYKLVMVMKDKERCPEIEAQMKNISRLLKTVCINTPDKELTSGFEKYPECPEPDVFIHNPKKEPTLLNVAKSEEKFLPKGVKTEFVSDTSKLSILQSILPKFGQSMVSNPYENTIVRKAVYGPIPSKDPKDKGKMQYTVNLQDEGSNFCPFKKCNHRGNHIYMRVVEGYSGNAIAQLKCYDEKCTGLTFGHKHMREDEASILFPKSIKSDHKTLIKLTDPQDAFADSENFFRVMKGAEQHPAKKKKVA